MIFAKLLVLFIIINRIKSQDPMISNNKKPQDDEQKDDIENQMVNNLDNQDSIPKNQKKLDVIESNHTLIQANDTTNLNQSLPFEIESNHTLIKVNETTNLNQSLMVEIKSNHTLIQANETTNLNQSLPAFNGSRKSVDVIENQTRQHILINAKEPKGSKTVGEGGIKTQTKSPEMKDVSLKEDGEHSDMTSKAQVRKGKKKARKTKKKSKMNKSQTRIHQNATKSEKTIKGKDKQDIPLISENENDKSTTIDKKTEKEDVKSTIDKKKVKNKSSLKNEKDDNLSSLANEKKDKVNLTSQNKDNENEEKDKSTLQSIRTKKKEIKEKEKSALKTEDQDDKSAIIDKEKVKEKSTTFPTTVSKLPNVEEEKVIQSDLNTVDNIDKEDEKNLIERYGDEVNPKFAEEKNKKTNKDSSSRGQKPYNKEAKSSGSGNHFVVILCFGLFVVIVGYVVFQKRKKILGFLIEGKRSTRSRRVSSTKESKVPYTQLDSEDKEAGSAGFKYVY